MPILSLILSCSYNDKQVDLAITKAEELLDVCPDSSLAILDGVDSLKTKWHTSQQMRYELVRAQAQNKAYINFSTDSILKEVVDYYDTHGTANERMTARYMLGCAYRDMEDAPRALESYNIAIQKEPDNSSNADKRLRSAIYSQMADLYHKQLLLSEEIECREQSIRISLHLADTLNTAYDCCKMAGAYCLQNDYEKAEACLKKGRDLYYDIRHISEWTLYSPMLIHLYLQHEDKLDSVRQMIDEYESVYGKANNDDPIPENQRQFYFYKGKYYEKIGKLDSAEIYYRKIHRSDMSFTQKDPMYRGLLSIYQKKNIPDSIAKYAQLYCEANDSSIAHADRELIGKMSALYRYDRYQQEAQMQNKVATERKYQLLLVIAVSIMMLMCLSFMIYRLKRRRIKDQEEKSRIMQEYKEAEKAYAERLHYISLLEQTHKNVMRLLKDELETTKTEADRCQSLYEESKKEIAKINRQYDELTNSYRSETERLKAKIDTLSRKGGISQNISRKLDLTSHPVIQKLLRHPNNPQEEINDKEWEQLVNIYCEYYPELVHDLQHCSHITRQGFHACLLFALDIRSGEVANILGLNIQRVTNLKSEINKSLFGDRSAKNLNSNLKQKYYICTGV